MDMQFQQENPVLPQVRARSPNSLLDVGYEVFALVDNSQIHQS